MKSAKAAARKWTLLTQARNDLSAFRDQDGRVSVCRSGRIPDESCWLVRGGDAMLVLAGAQVQVNFQMSSDPKGIVPDELFRWCGGLHLVPVLRKYGYSISACTEIAEAIEILRSVE